MDTDNLCQCLSWEKIDGSPETEAWADFSCPANCGGCEERNHHFGLVADKGRLGEHLKARIGFTYHFKAKHFEIDRVSERLTINFCPWCGRLLSDELVPFEKSCLNFEMGTILIKD